MSYLHPFDRHAEWCPSERDDALADLNAHLERGSVSTSNIMDSRMSDGRTVREHVAQVGRGTGEVSA